MRKKRRLALLRYRPKILRISKHPKVIVFVWIGVVDSAFLADAAVLGPLRIAFVPRPQIRESKCQPRPDSNVIRSQVWYSFFLSVHFAVHPNQRKWGNRSLDRPHGRVEVPATCLGYQHDVAVAEPVEILVLEQNLPFSIRGRREYSSHDSEPAYVLTRFPLNGVGLHERAGGSFCFI